MSIPRLDLPPAGVIPVNIATRTTNLLLAQFPVVLLGWAWHETTGSASALLRLRNGNDTTGSLVVPISLTSSESTRDWLGPTGLDLPVGLFLEVASGSIEGAVWVSYTRPY